MLFKWFNKISVLNTIYIIRNYTLEFKYSVPEWIYFTLPDALWYYSFNISLILLWNPKKFKDLFLILIIPFTLSIGVELLQFFKLFKGTFDFFDLVFYIISLFLTILFFNYSYYEKRL